MDINADSVLSLIYQMPFKGDEIEIDGKLCCPVCNQARQAIFYMGGIKHTARCICKCEEDEYQQEKTKMEVSEKKKGIKDEAYLTYTFDKSEADITFAKRYCDEFEKYKSENIGMQLMGECGCGKTYIAACIANELTDKNYSVLMANVLWILQRASFKNPDADSFLQSLQGYDLLIIDDFGAQRGTEYTSEQIYNVVDMRYRARKPLIITTNLSRKDINEEQDVKVIRVYDRLKEMCHPVALKTASFRKAKASERFKSLNAQLGIGE